MIRNVILIDYEPFTKRREELFFIRNFIDSGFNVQIWDISKYLYRTVHIVDTIENRNYIFKVSTYTQLKCLLDNTDISNTVFFIECFDTWKARKLRWLLSDHHCYTIKMDLYANTVLYESFSSKLSRLFSSSFFEIVQGKIEYFFLTCYKIIHKVKGPTRYLSSSSLVKRTDEINHPDYENFYFKRCSSVKDDKYIVFCDIFFPFHPDLVYYSKYKKMPDGKKYQATMRHFFDYLDDIYKMPVIIAAHPKSDYSGYEFGNRRIIKYQTDILVMHASMVVQHNSNSISYAVMADKPVAFITTNGYQSVPRMGKELSLLASTLGKQVYNLDLVPFDEVKIDFIDEKIRKKYIYTYLTSPKIETVQNWDIVSGIVSHL